MHHHADLLTVDVSLWAVIAAVAWAGLVSGVSHCLGMCGPFVMAQSARRMASDRSAVLGEFRRLRGVALLPYHLGRATVYTGLGAAVGLLSSAIVAGLAFKLAIAALMALAGLLMLQPALAPTMNGASVALGAPISGILSRLAGSGGGYRMGLALGFLPCGMVYTALAAAAATGSPGGGAVAMAAFALGTMPGLIALAFLGELAGKRLRAAMAKAAPWLLAVNGLFLLAIAVVTVI